jgi:undecaprenyl-diphosphatase
MFIWAIIPSYSRIYLGVHYPGDILCGAMAGCIIACLIYAFYYRIQKKVFEQGEFISTQYTSSGFETKDIRLLHTILLCTYIYAIIAAMIFSKLLYL